jgi:5-methylcytosine-specific restriction endonuclease McrA
MTPRPSRTRRRFTRADLEAVAARHGAACIRCGGPVDLELPGTELRGPTIDHYLIRWADGGTDALDNLRLAHSSCNKAAGRRPPLELGPRSRQW